MPSGRPGGAGSSTRQRPHRRLRSARVSGLPGELGRTRPPEPGRSRNKYIEAPARLTSSVRPLATHPAVAVGPYGPEWLEVGLPLLVAGTPHRFPLGRTAPCTPHGFLLGRTAPWAQTGTRLTPRRVTTGRSECSRPGRTSSSEPGFFIARRRPGSIWAGPDPWSPGTRRQADTRSSAGPDETRDERTIVCGGVRPHPHGDGAVGGTPGHQGVPSDRSHDRLIF